MESVKIPIGQADKELLIPYNPAAKTAPPKVKKHKVESFLQHFCNRLGLPLIFAFYLTVGEG